ncbi:Na+/H+ antiporter NhaC [Robertmurraya korlensis]|uniref:Na+/H+ antiporter NhaC n=1 Tax=Robertmurraya korlensis TaxID=519977 RepID=UPI002041092C|nr:Na+/H+ antiporter NhaC [Robertmurraya korlensis]MCM3602553.1 Na+/H+ antiporter NhaC [Robertmurraya korlensis]
MNQDSVLTLKPIEAFIISLIVIGGISYSLIFAGAVPHIPIVLAIMGLFVYGICKKVSVKELEEAIINGAKSGAGAVFIFLFIGMLISSWMESGTIPTFIYLALEVVSDRWFYAIVFAVTAIIGMSIGSSLTTAATIGVAFMSVSTALGLSDAITAGAVISGAFFGDKMSPLSDTTILASSTVHVDLFDHIRNMAWTTVPAFILSFLLFVLLSPAESAANFANLDLLKASLKDHDLVHWYSLLPFVVLALLAIKKVPAIITLASGIATSLIVTLFVQKEINLQGLMNTLFSGYSSNTGVEEIDSMLSRGGMDSMMFSVSLILLALAMGGLFFKLGILPALLAGISGMLNKVWSLVVWTAGTAITINFLVGEQYLSILLTGSSFKERYKKMGLHGKNLSRILEDAGTVVNPLVPWSVCGVFLTGVLGVETLSYLPFTFFCLLSPVITMIFGITGFKLSKQEE